MTQEVNNDTPPQVVVAQDMLKRFPNLPNQDGARENINRIYKGFNFCRVFLSKYFVNEGWLRALMPSSIVKYFSIVASYQHCIKFERTLDVASKQIDDRWSVGYHSLSSILN
jgi:hypothetical protein